MNRRNFLKQTGLVVGLEAAQNLAHGAGQGVSIIVSPEDKVASSGPPRWAAGELQTALKERGVPVRLFPRVEAAPAGDRCIVVSGNSTSGNVSVPVSPEGLVLAPDNP